MSDSRKTSVTRSSKSFTKYHPSHIDPQLSAIRRVDEEIAALNWHYRRDFVTSLVGHHNPFTAAVNPINDKILIFDGIAYRTNSEQTWRGQLWETNLFALYCIADESADLTRVCVAICQAAGINSDVAMEERIAKRLRQCFSTSLPARTALIQLHCDVNSQHSSLIAPLVGVERDGNPRNDALGYFAIGPSNRHGFSNNIVSMAPTASFDGQVVNVCLSHNFPTISASIRLCAGAGWAICSSINDTLKHTNIRNDLGCLRSMFVDAPDAIEGMAELFSMLSIRLQNPPFWYLSASPFSLYPFIREFLDGLYPHGEVSLRQRQCKDFTSLLDCLTEGVRDFKVKELQRLHEFFPKRRFILIGNSNQVSF